MVIGTKLTNLILKEKINKCFFAFYHRSAAKKFFVLPQKTDCYLIETSIKKNQISSRTSKIGESRIPESFEFHLGVKIIKDENKLENLCYEAGCFP